MKQLRISTSKSEPRTKRQTLFRGTLACHAPLRTFAIAPHADAKQPRRFQIFGRGQFDEQRDMWVEHCYRKNAVDCGAGAIPAAQCRGSPVGQDFLPPPLLYGFSPPPQRLLSLSPQHYGLAASRSIQRLQPPCSQQQSLFRSLQSRRRSTQPRQVRLRTAKRHTR